MNVKKIDGVGLNVDRIKELGEEGFLNDGVSKLFQNQDEAYLRKVYRLATDTPEVKKVERVKPA